MLNRYIYKLLLGCGLAVGINGQALSADLGGDCCADLEERVAVLETTTARKGNRAVSLQIYGQVNRALLYFDDGRTSDVYSVDNDSSTSRVGFRGKVKINSKWSAGYRIEIGVHSAESDRVDAEANADDEENNGDDGRINDNVNLRRSSLFIAHKDYGKLTVGLTNHALDKTTRADLGKTSVIARNGGLRFIEGFDVIPSGGGATNPGGVDWDRLLPGDFEFSKDDVVRYDTPTFAGFKASASWGEDDEHSFALFYAGKFGDIKVAAGVGYGYDTEGDTQVSVNGSASIMHTPTGLFLSGSGGQRDNKTDGYDEEFYQVKGGIVAKVNSLGKTTFYGEHIGTDIQNIPTRAGGDATVYGGGVIQKIDAAAMELYAGYRHYEADLDSLVPTEDFTTVVTGARIKF